LYLFGLCLFCFWFAPFEIVPLCFWFGPFEIVPFPLLVCTFSGLCLFVIGLYLFWMVFLLLQSGKHNNLNGVKRRRRQWGKEVQQTACCTHAHTSPPSWCQPVALHQGPLHLHQQAVGEDMTLLSLPNILGFGEVHLNFFRIPQNDTAHWQQLDPHSQDH